MKHEFPAAVPEIPVSDLNKALDYYEAKLRFNIDWGGADGGIAGISKGDCRTERQNCSRRRLRAGAGTVQRSSWRI